LWCLFDITGRPVWELGRVIEGNPRKGKERIRETCQLDSIRGSLFALYDDDRVRELPNLSAQLRKREVAERLRSESTNPNETRILLLKPNIEAVTGAVLECLQQPALAGKPNPIERDRILRRIFGDGATLVRQCVLTKVPALKCLVDELRPLVQPGDADDATGSRSD
jgi:hypothetical protein